MAMLTELTKIVLYIVEVKVELLNPRLIALRNDEIRLDFFEAYSVIM